MARRTCTAVLALAALLALPLAAQTLVQTTATSGTADAGLYSTGAAWGDYDGDGDLDLYVTNWATSVSVPTNRLFQNQDGGTFVDVAPDLGLDNAFNSSAAAWGDYDSDGDLDLYVADFYDQDYLYENGGQGASFTEVGRHREIVNLVKQGSVTSVAWGDYDGDGYLDFYLGKYYYDNELYHNEGDGTFTQVLDVGAGDRRDTNAFTWVDYDGDGDLDLYVVNRDQENGLFRNDLSTVGRFSDIASAAGVASTEIGQASAWGDYDNDGDLDLFVANVGANALYRNDGADTFAEVGTLAGVRQSSSGWITADADWADYDGDGDLDLYLATGGDEQQQPDLLFANRGDGSFADATAAAGLPTGATPHLCATWADYDGDGAPDLYATDGWGLGNRLYHNQAPDSLFIRVQVRGKGPAADGSSPAGFGAHVWLIDNATQDTVAYQQVLPGVAVQRSVGGVLGSEVLFGAPAGPYDIAVRFPGNAIRRLISVVRGGDQVIVEEP
ncbi:MAG: VCBS repeat-containing protein [Gemmatimonadota bacterium]